MALMNAYIQPLMTGYLDRLSQRIRGLGLSAPIYITSNNGGTLSIDTARQRPIDTILSGPASGVVAASVVAGQTPFDNLITLDMGGTSADMSVIQQREPAQTTRTQVGGLPLIVPVVAVSAVGAGGGSIVWVDRQGALKVGPSSAGAAPGPACYGNGGTEATLTDCYLVAGYIDPAHFLGGRLQLDTGAARAALETVADALGMTGEHRAEHAAEAAIRITTAVMSSEIARDLAQKGEEARNYALVAFGGAGPTHANHIADDAGIASVLVPLTPSTFCALGAILANVKRDFVSSHFLRLADGAPALAALTRDFDRLEQTASSWIGSEGDILGSNALRGQRRHALCRPGVRAAGAVAGSAASRARGGGADRAVPPGARKGLQLPRPFQRHRDRRRTAARGRRDPADLAASAAGGNARRRQPRRREVCSWTAATPMRRCISATISGAGRCCMDRRSSSRRTPRPWYCRDGRPRWTRSATC